MNDDVRRTSTARSNNQFAVPSRTPNPERTGSCRQAIAALVDRLALTRPLAVLDLETTGVCVERDRIVQIGILRIEPGGDYAEYDRVVNPGMPIPGEASAIHGITDEMVAAAPTLKQIARDVGELLLGADICGYNTRKFDAPLLLAELARIGSPWTLGGVVLDPLLLWQRMCPRTLAGAVAEFGGVDDFQGHAAIDDVRATVVVLDAMLKRWRNLPTGVEALAEYAVNRDPSWIDADGKVVFKRGEACLNFGKFAGRTLRDLAMHDPDYLAWIGTRDFSVAVKSVVGDALNGTFPIDVSGRTIVPDVAAANVPVVWSNATIEAPVVQPGPNEDPSSIEATGGTWPEDLSRPDEPEWIDLGEASFSDVGDVSWLEVEDTGSTDIDDLTDVPVETPGTVEPAEPFHAHLRLVGR